MNLFALFTAMFDFFYSFHFKDSFPCLIFFIPFILKVVFHTVMIYNGLFLLSTKTATH